MHSSSANGGTIAPRNALPLRTLCPRGSSRRRRVLSQRWCAARADGGCALHVTLRVMTSNAKPSFLEETKRTRRVVTCAQLRRDKRRACTPRMSHRERWQSVVLLTARAQLPWPPLTRGTLILPPDNTTAAEQNGWIASRQRELAPLPVPSSSPCGWFRDNCRLVPIGTNWYQLVPIGTNWYWNRVLMDFASLTHDETSQFTVGFWNHFCYAYHLPPLKAEAQHLSECHITLSTNKNFHHCLV